MYQAPSGMLSIRKRLESLVLFYLWKQKINFQNNTTTMILCVLKDLSNFHLNYVDLKGQTRLDKKKYPIMLRKRIRTVNNTWIVNAKMIKYFKKHCNVYMYFSYEGCKTFRIKVQPTNGTLVAAVYSSGLNYLHNPDDNGLTNHVKGFQRDLNKEVLKKN